MLPGPLESSVLDGDLRIGDFVVRPLLKVVRPISADETGEETTLPDKAMAVLVYLAQHSRQVCDREAILDAVWGPDREAYDRVLDNAIREIRRALNDDARNPTYIQTIPKKGYRLLVAVESRLLEKQRESSGEFVPILGPAQVFRRVQRKAASGEPEAAPSPLETTISAESSPGSAVRGVRILAIATVLLLFLTGSAWRSGIFRPDQLTIAVDARALKSHQTSAPDDSTPHPDAFVEALRTAIFDHHPCGDRSVYRPGSWLRKADYRVRLDRADDSGTRLLMAKIEPTQRRAVLNPDAGLPDAPNALARAATQQLDLAACNLERLPDIERACHCLEGSRRSMAIPESQLSLEELELAITLDPDLIPAYEVLAEAFRDAGDFKEGMAVLKTGLARVEDLDSTAALGMRLQLARLLMDRGEEQRLLEELHDRHPEDPKWRLALASFLTLHYRRCDEALELLEPLFEDESHSAAVTIERARALWFCGEPERMVEAVRQQVEKYPRQAELRRWFAAMLSLVGRSDEARRYANEAIALEPENSENYWALGLVAYRQGRYAAAESWYLKAEEMSRWPRDEAFAIIGLARVALARGDTARCLELTSSLEESDVRTQEPPLLLQALCLAESGRIAEARASIDTFHRSLSVGVRRDSQALSSLIEAKIELAEASTPAQQRQAVLRLLGTAELQPMRVAMFNYESAIALAQIGDSEGAKEWLQKALKVNPNHPWSLCRLGMLQQERGEAEAAADSMRRGLDVFGPNLEDPLAVECDEALRRLAPGEV